MSKIIQLFPTRKKPRPLSEERNKAYSQLINNRLATPLAVIEKNTFYLLKDGQKYSWKIPWSLPNGNRLIIKMEHLSDYNPTGSCYDRLYPYLFQQWETRGFIHPGKNNSPVIECSAGNAGAAFCYAATKLGYPNHKIIIPEDIYPARIAQIKGFGGDVIFSPKDKGELGYIRLIEKLLRNNNGKSKVGRYRNRLFPVTNTIRVPNKPYAQLVQEVYNGLKAIGLPQRIDTFIFGIGSGNTISQTSIAIRKMQLHPLDVNVVEFKECPFIATILKGKHPPTNGGWPSGDMAGTVYGVPLNKLNIRLNVINKVIPLSASERKEGRHIANDILGLFAGRPTGMGPIGALKIAKKKNNNNIFMIVFDSIAKYEDHYDAIMNVDFEHGKPIRMSEREAVRLAVS